MRALSSASIYAAVPLPDGDPEFGVAGPLVMLVERQPPENPRAGEVRRVRFLCPEEAVQLARVLADATFRLGCQEARLPAAQELV